MKAHLYFGILVAVGLTCSAQQRHGLLDSLSGTVGLLGNTLNSVLTSTTDVTKNLGGALGNTVQMVAATTADTVQALQHQAGGALGGLTDILEDTVEMATDTLTVLPEIVSNPLVGGGLLNGGGFFGVKSICETIVKHMSNFASNVTGFFKQMFETFIAPYFGGFSSFFKLMIPGL